MKCWFKFDSKVQERKDNPKTFVISYQVINCKEYDLDEPLKAFVKDNASNIWPSS